MRFHFRIFSDKLFELIDDDAVVGGESGSRKKRRYATSTVRTGVGAVRPRAVVES